MEDKNIWEEEIKEMNFQGIWSIIRVDNEIMKNYGWSSNRESDSQEIKSPVMIESDTDVYKWLQQGVI